MTPQQNQTQYKSILIGALIGAFVSLLPSTIMAYVQARNQFKQAIFEHRLKALTDLSETVNVEGLQVLHKTYILEVDIETIEDMERVPKTEQDRIIHETQEFSQVTSEFVGKLNSQISVVNAVFAGKQANLAPLTYLADQFSKEDASEVGGKPIWQWFRNGKEAQAGLIKLMSLTRQDTTRKIQELQKAITALRGAIID